MHLCFVNNRTGNCWRDARDEGVFSTAKFVRLCFGASATLNNFSGNVMKCDAHDFRFLWSGLVVGSLL